MTCHENVVVSSTVGVFLSKIIETTRLQCDGYQSSNEIEKIISRAYFESSAMSSNGVHNFLWSLASNLQIYCKICNKHCSKDCKNFDPEKNYLVCCCQCGTSLKKTIGKLLSSS